jgi:hypothetical protein
MMNTKAFVSRMILIVLLSQAAFAEEVVTLKDGGL